MNAIITIYALATLLISGEPRDFYSQQLTFQNRTQCIEFFQGNKAQLMNGLKEYARKTYESEVEIAEAGCALVDFSRVTAGGKPTIIQKVSLYNASSI